MNNDYDVAVVGAGPGGYVAAIRGAQLGKKVLLIEKEKIGGVCTNWGCIPTKWLIHQSMLFSELRADKNLEGPVDEIKMNLKKCQENKQRCVDSLVKGVEFLLKKNRITVKKGEASFQGPKEIVIDGKDGKESAAAKKIILATGSRPGNLPFIKVNGKEVLNSKQALDMKEVPSHLIVIGAGAVGLEIACLFHRLGSRVTVLEIMPQILPGIDEEAAKCLHRELKKQGLEILTGMKIQESRIKDGLVTLRGVSLQRKSSFEYSGEKVLTAAGRRPNSEKIKEGLPELDLDEAGFVKVNEYMETSQENIYAIGDLVGGKLLAHKASHEGIVAVENACGNRMSMDYRAVPLSVFTEPEYACVGLTEEEAREQYKDDVRIGKFPLRACGRALTMGKTEGFVKIIAREEGEILGAHILSHCASEMLPEVTLALKHGMKASELSSVIHAHPTLSESIREAALSVQNRAIHILNLTHS